MWSLAVLFAGCVHGAQPVVVNSAPAAPSGESSLPIAPPPEPEIQPPQLPGIANVTAELRGFAAEVRVPAGQYQLVRLIYDANVWGEELPWDGDAQTSVGFVWDVQGDGTNMGALGFQPPPFVEDRRIRPYIDFVPVTGKGWMWTSTSSSCSGDCDEHPPAHQRAVLIGSANGASTLRIGIFDDGEPEQLWSRDTISIAPDATTSDAFAGQGLRVMALLEEYRSSSGILQADWSGTSAPTGAALERTSRYQGQAQAQEPGILSLGITAVDTLGLETWDYHLRYGGVANTWAGPWAWATGNTHIAASAGVIWPPRASVQDNAPAGPVLFDANLTFTGQSDPTALAAPSFEIVRLGHAGLDLDALFGWNASQPANPDANGGVADCTRSSLLPDVTMCHGDGDVAPPLR